MNFGNVLKSIRESRDMTLEEMALFLGTTKQALSRYERGERTPKITAAARFADLLGVPLKDLVGEDEKPPDSLLKAPKTEEAQILAQGIDKLPKKQREQALNVVKAMFAQYSDYFEKGSNDETEL